MELEALSDAVDARIDRVRHGALRRLGTTLEFAQRSDAFDIHDSTGRFRMFLPRADDVDLDLVALAVVVRSMVDVRGRFPWAGIPLLVIDDTVAHARKRLGGFMDSHSREIHIDRLWLVRGGMLHTRLQHITVHECWHAVENSFTALRHRRSAEFRAALGALLGLKTLEHAFLPNRHIGEPGRAEARQRLRDAAGDYATTGHLEATAELFAASWIGSTHPLVTAFADLVDEFLPVRL